MNRKDFGQAIPRDDRIRSYRGTALLSDVDSRIFGVEMHWAAHLAARACEDAVRAEGHLRISVALAVGLAAHRTRKRAHAERKSAFLALVGDRLDAHVEGDAHQDHRGAIPMLAAAADAEVRRWGLPRPTPGGGEPRAGFPNREPSPALDRSLRFNACIRTLAEVVADVDIMYADGLALAEELDWAGVRGIADDLKVALLHALAVPAAASDDFDLKLWVIREWGEYLRPSDLTRPMLEAVIPADAERLGRQVDLVSLLASLPPVDSAGRL